MSENPQLKKYLKAARSFMRQEKYGDALAHFVLLAHTDPSSKISFIEEFITALRRWTEILEHHGEFEKVMVCYEQALQLYPQSETILNNMGATLFKLGCHDEAASCFRRALLLNPNCTQAKESLGSVANVLVERWHFRMLNDKKRNEAYKMAIVKAVAEGYDTVLDIGSGTGILSMFAVQAGAKKVYACEMSKTMYEMSLDVLAANQLKDSVNVIHNKSTDLKIGADLSSHVSLIVTEILDCGLLGEGILPTIRHAWACLLQPITKQEENFKPWGDHPNEHSVRPHSKVIPAKACVYATVISCEAIRLCTRLKKLNIAGIDLSSVYVVGGEKVSFAEVPTDNHISVLEPYTTECLSTIAGGYNFLTNIFPVTEYNFNDPTTFEKQPLVSFKIPVQCSGSVDAIAMWFDLYLDDEVCLNTGPCGGSTCWEQAVYPVYFHHLQSTPADLNILQGKLPVDAGDILTIAGEFSNDCLKLKCTGINKSQDIAPKQEFLHQSHDKTSYQKVYSLEVKSEHCVRKTLANKDQPRMLSLTKTQQNQKDCTSTETGDFPTAKPVSNTVSNLPEQKQEGKSNVDNNHQFSEEKNVSDFDNLNNDVDAIKDLSLSPQKSEEKTDTVSCRQTIVVPPSYMRQLNDDMFYSTYLEAVEKAVISVQAIFNQEDEPSLSHPSSPYDPSSLEVNHSSLIKQHKTCNRGNGSLQTNVPIHITCRVLDVTKGPSLVGPIIANAEASHVLLSYSDTGFSKALRSSLVSNSNCELEFGPSQLEDIATEGKIWDVLVAEVVEPTGVLRQQAIEDIVLSKGCLLKPTTHKIVPSAVTILAFCIESPLLHLQSKVTHRSNTLDLSIGRFINHFQVNTHIDIGLNSLEHTALTDKTELFHIDFMQNFQDEQDVLGLLELKTQQIIKVHRTGTIHAVPYWFILHFPGCNNSKLSTFTGAYPGSHWRQAVVVLKDELPVKEGQSVLISATCKDSCVSVSVQTLAE